MVVGEAIHNIMGGIENTGTVKQHSHKKKLRQRFDIIKKLGQGTFGKVQLGINKETGQEVAIKTIKKSKIESEADLVRIRREIQIMSSVQHPNIIHIYEVFENREKMVLVMEYAAGGELYDYLSERKVLDEEEARRIFRQIATACYYCHKHKICHRDLKLENILLDENNNAKIADFGLSNVFDDQRLLNTFCGSPLYASPEIVKGTPYHGPEVDCWSLGVLLYTLVYGAMPFDGSNFKRLVKQISQGDYFEPAKPSPASPLIREMLTVNPKHRSDIEKICSHWWVNEGYNESCLEISEELANQTPVRLDVLLSLAPPPPQLESEKLMLTGEDENTSMAPARSQSVGSLMELAHPAHLINEDKTTPKRKLEVAVSTDQINLDKRKEKIVKENTVADITVSSSTQDDTSSNLNRSSTQTISKEMDVEPADNAADPCAQGAVCTELIEESEKKKAVKLKKALSVSGKVLEGINENPSQENLINKENVKEEPPVKEPKAGVKNKVPVKKKVLKDKNDNNATAKPVPKTPSPEEEKKPNNVETEQKVDTESTKPIERRKSRIFEAAEKFQNMITPPETKQPPFEKPKKIIIPGVSVDGFKKEFERKASLTSTSPPKVKGALTRKESKDEKKHDEEAVEVAPKEETTEKLPTKTDDDNMKERVRNAVSIISSALDKEGARKSKSRPCMMRKPPVPFGVSGRSASGNIGMLTGPKPFVKPNFDEKPEVKVETKQEQIEEDNAALKSATLPRRKTVRAEITLNYPLPQPANMIIKTEFGHSTENGQTTPTFRGEIIVPTPPGFRPKEQEQKAKSASRERIIPISFETQETTQERVQSPPVKPPVPKPFQTQQSNSSQGSNLSRQSTQESDTETQTSTGEPIKKSPREYIIPIAVEGGGYVTPRAGSLEPSETSSSTLTNKSKSKFGRARRFNSIFSDRDSEDESSPFSTLHRRGSIGKDSDNEDSKRDIFHMHRLRSTRPRRSHLEHNDSVSSGEDDDDEGFEILTAENLFSTLLSRVRDLTQRLNVDDGVRPGFPSSRLLSHFDRGANFWNRIDHPLSRHSSLGRTLSGERPTLSKTSTGNSFGVPWRRTVSRDTSSETPTESATPAQRPIGDVTQEENLNLADLDLKKLKLSDEDALALSYLTPGLSKRIQQQLLSQLAPREARKLHRTMSSRIPEEKEPEERISSTLPRKLSTNEEIDGRVHALRMPRSFLPVKRDEYRPSYEFNVRSSSIGAEPRCDTKFFTLKPKITKSTSRKADLQSPDSSVSDSYRNTDSSNSSISRPYSKYSDTNRYKTLESDVGKCSKRVSRFLRPDFYEQPKEENVYLKEKKEREMETQKVLKEIRDKRKSRLRRERSLSKEKQLENETKDDLLNGNHAKSLHSYVNVPAASSVDENKTSKAIHDYVNVKAAEKPTKKDHASKIARPKSYPTENLCVDKKSPEKETKIAKFRKNFTKPKEKTKEDKNETNEDEKLHNKNKLLHSIEKKLEKLRSNKDTEEKSTVENAIKRLREQSLPRNMEHCTESGLIKRAVSVEDLPTGTKPLQTSKKSVTKILGLFKKYEEGDNKTNGNKKKVTKKGKSNKSEQNNINNNNNDNSNGFGEMSQSESSTSERLDKKERPRSLFFEKVKQFNSDINNKETKVKSKLPVNSFRRSLNLEPNDKKNLKLDLNNAPSEENRNSLTTDDSSTILSPSEDYMSCDSWSVCSDFHHINDLHSPTSPNGNVLYSGDENESVVDRIRRKSFYTRFNEKKRTRRPTTNSYRDLDLNSYRTTPALDYGAFDRYKSLDRRSSYGTGSRESSGTKTYRPYARTSSLMNDYINVPDHYQPYSSKIGRPSSSCAYSTPENDAHLDELLSTAKAKKYSSQRLGRTNSSPMDEYYVRRSPSSEPI